MTIGVLRYFFGDRRSRDVNTSGQHRRVTDEFLDTIRTNRLALDELEHAIEVTPPKKRNGATE